MTKNTVRAVMMAVGSSVKKKVIATAPATDKGPDMNTR